jgi:hypothetical protein
MALLREAVVYALALRQAARNQSLHLLAGSGQLTQRLREGGRFHQAAGGGAMALAYSYTHQRRPHELRLAIPLLSESLVPIFAVRVTLRHAGARQQTRFKGKVKLDCLASFS